METAEDPSNFRVSWSPKILKEKGEEKKKRGKLVSHSGSQKRNVGQEKFRTVRTLRAETTIPTDGSNVHS